MEFDSGGSSAHPINIHYWSSSDLGLKRENNEDSFYPYATSFDVAADCYADGHPFRLFIVADGMGGHNGGEIASRIAIEEITKQIRENLSTQSYSDLVALDSQSKESFYKRLISDAIIEANTKIIKESKTKKDLEGMGTTAVMLLFPSAVSNQAYFANVGDSRAYLIKQNDNSIIQISKDHTVVAEMVQKGLLSREKVKSHRLRHVLTQSLGADSHLSLDLEKSMNSVELNEGDYLLLCSDGLTDMLSDEEIKETVFQTHQRNEHNQISDCNDTEAIEDERKIVCNLKHTTESLIKNANENGGRDNITVILVQNKTIRPEHSDNSTAKLHEKPTKEFNHDFDKNNNQQDSGDE